MGEHFINPEASSEAMLDQVVDSLLRQGDQESAIRFLTSNPDQTTSFCVKVKEAYREGDNSGLYEIAGLLEEVVKRLPK